MQKFAYRHNDIDMTAKSGTTIEKFNQVAETIKAAAHPERLAIINLLWSAGKPAHVKNIYRALHLEQSTVSRHLGILKRCGLLSKEGSGNNSTYSLNLENAITTSMINCLQHT